MSRRISLPFFSSRLGLHRSASQQRVKYKVTTNRSSETSPPTFVFFHVGDNVELPSMLVDSINWSNPDSTIVFCTDEYTPEIKGVSRRVEITGDRDRLMTYRLAAFARSGVEQPAIYLDTDMLVLKELNPAELLGGCNIAMCRRFFSLDAPFNGNFGGLDFREYDQKPLGQIYPYVACCTITRDASLWHSLHQILLDLDPKFHIWYGDQEALREFAKKNAESTRPLSEEIFGCLPEEVSHLSKASIIHFKGAARKAAMKLFHERLTRSITTAL
jgi:hypothetical protein